MANKTRVELRLDDSVYRGLKALAEEAGLSLNQLLSGVARWANESGQAGRPHHAGGGFIETIIEEGVVWFGESGMDQDGDPVGGGDVAFVLDYTDRSAVQRWEPGHE